MRSTRLDRAWPDHAVSQRGIALVEALLAFLVLALGMLAIARVQSELRAYADLARQRSDAARIAGAQMERLRSFSVLAPSAQARSYAAITDASTETDAGAGTGDATRYEIERVVGPIANAQASAVTVTVRWTDHRGDTQHTTLSSVIARSDPVLAAALATAPVGTPVKGALGRSSRVPLFAKDLGDGRSAFKPAGDGSVAFVQDNGSGLVTARCTGLAPTLATAALAAANLTSCDTTSGHLLSGTVRFADTSPADPASASAALLPFDIVLSLGGGAYEQPPACVTTPVESGNRRSVYHCVVYPPASGRWSGRSALAPIGWRIGTTAGEHRVCRFSSDLDGSGAIDTNLEHPAAYADVDTALAQQNFLVIDGADTCPAAAALRAAGEASGVYADLGTTQHQP